MSVATSSTLYRAAIQAFDVNIVIIIIIIISIIISRNFYWPVTGCKKVIELMCTENKDKLKSTKQ